jgi:aryl-alcohol dehydrogenase-like predicted oxidoreductase
MIYRTLGSTGEKVSAIGLGELQGCLASDEDDLGNMINLFVSLKR